MRPRAKRDPDRQSGGYHSSNNTQSKPRMDKSTVKCWHCGKLGYFSRECRGLDKGFRFAPACVQHIRSLDIDHLDNQSDSGSSQEDLA